MKFERISDLIILKRLIDHSLKLLLAGTNLQIDTENSSEFSAEAFFKMSNFGVKF